MGFESFAKKMETYFGVKAEEYPQNRVAKTYMFKIQPHHIREVAKLLKEEGFNFFHTLSPVDYSPKGRGLELNYFFESIEERIWVLIRTEIPLENPEIDSIHDIFPALEACERELTSRDIRGSNPFCSTIPFRGNGFRGSPIYPNPIESKEVAVCIRELK